MSHTAPPPICWSRGRLQTLGHCPACLTARGATEAAYIRRDDDLTMPDDWQMHRCETCHSVYLDPRPTDDSLAAAYDNYLTHQAGNEEASLASEGLLWGLVRDYLRWRFGLETGVAAVPGGRLLFRLLPPLRQKLDRFGRHLTRQAFPEGGTLLDIGCGNGDFMLLARAMGWKVVGVEPDPKAAALCASRGLDVLNGGIEAMVATGKRFDAVTLSHVIEHVPAPRETLAHCLELLRPGGMIWLGLPNPAAVGSKLFGTAWAGLHPPYHLCLPGQAELEKWLAAAGFTDIRVLHRGVHARANWSRSREIGSQHGLRFPPVAVAIASRLLADALSTLTPRWSEETIIVARRPA
jgi:SAM-dependent methyltransferase